MALRLVSEQREPEERKGRSESLPPCPPGEGVAAPDPGGRGSDQRVNGASVCCQYCRSMNE